MTLGKLIRTERQRRDWTLRQMSETVGIPLSTLAKVEQDRLSLAYDKLQQFTARLGLTMAKDCESALALAVCSSEDTDLSETLMNLTTRL
jgi:transcriptional regulator with XRE-family HTH domain